MNYNFFEMLIACSISSILSLLLISSFKQKQLQSLFMPFISLSIGLMLGLSFLHGLPEVFELGMPIQHIFYTLLLGILSLFLLEKFGIFRHDHHHEEDGHAHEKGYNQKLAKNAGIGILMGSSIHRLADGLLIGTAFLHSQLVGWMTASSIIIHEIPQMLGDFMIFKHAGLSRVRLFVYALIMSLVVIVGGCLAWLALPIIQEILPYILTFGYSFLIYVAISDLLPQIHHHHSRQELFSQLVFMAIGLGFIFFLNDHHHHGHQNHHQRVQQKEHQDHQDQQKVNKNTSKQAHDHDHDHDHDHE
jgi:zinc and cadmium transporter